jgi:hypothetical protein
VTWALDENPLRIKGIAREMSGTLPEFPLLALLNRYNGALACMPVLEN